MSDGWQISDADRMRIARLVRCVRSLVPKADSGQALTAIGESWAALDELYEHGTEPDIIVSLDLGYERGDAGFNEGFYICLEISSEGIVLKELHRSYSRDAGSDHFSVPHAHFLPDGTFDEQGFEDWMDAFDRTLRTDDAKLQSTRDHI